MLALTPTPLQTDGERAFFNELVRWDTGASVRAAVVASIPFGDGPLQRRLSDAVLFVPEGVAVIRVAEVVRQSGVVTASPEGPWTIGPPGTGGAVLQLGGGGSTPLDGLMRAGMEVAVRLRRAGLEPGRIARLTVLTGDVTGLLPTDGDLGEGDQVALLEPRSLLLGIARCSRYSGVDNPRLWTTADVRAALEALGLQGRGPSVEELNGESFPYSPYVLRRPELLTPAAIAASPVPGVETPAAAGPDREQPSSAAIAQAVAASAAAAQAAADAESRTTAPAPTPPAPTTQAPTTQAPTAAAAVPPPVAAATPPAQRDTVAVDGPPAPPEDAGIGGLFAHAEPEDSPTPPHAPPARPATFAVPPAAPAPPPVYAPPPSPGYWGGPEADEEEPEGRSRRGLLLAVLGAVAVVLLGVGGWLLLRSDPQGFEGSQAGGTTPAEAPPTGAAPGTVQVVDGVSYTLEAAQVDDTCVGHAYGEVAAFFATTNCTGLSRALWSAEVEGAPVVVSVARVQMPDTAVARELRALADRNGSGNVNDLLREGVTYDGAPDGLSGAEYASAVSGPTVTIVESSWVDGDSAGDTGDIDKVASDGLALETPPIPTE